MKNNLLEELLALGIQARIDSLTERFGYAALGVQPMSPEREARNRALYNALLEVQFQHASFDSEATLEDRVRNVTL